MLCETCREESKYNGWSNYETWAVNLWLTNEESSQRHWRERGEEARRLAESEPDDVLTKEERAKIALADQLRDEITEASPLADSATLYEDLLGAAFSEVDWAEIAQAFLERD